MLAVPTQIADWLVILPVVLPLLGAALALMVRHSGAYLAGFAMLVVLAMIACESALLLRVLESGPVSMTMGRWLPPFGISFTADVVSAGFALTSAVLAFVLLLYGEGERNAGGGRESLPALILLLLAGVTGSFLTGDLFNLYVWFEVMLIASFGLLVLGGSTLQLDGAVKYAFPNFIATTLFLAGLGLLYGLLGTLNMADIAMRAPSADRAAMTGIAALFLLAFCTKAAAFPVNAWLPASYHTPPAGISAVLAGLLTKVGIYALLRTMTTLLPGSRDVLDPVIAALAILTLVIGPMGAIAETNLRRAIGFILIGGIGAVLAGLALPSLSGLAGGSLYIFHAMLTMAGLYMVAGLIESLTGETDSRLMGGVYAAHSGLSILFLLLILAAAGVPPMLGFWPKLLLLQAGFERAGAAAAMDFWGMALIVALLLNAILTLIAGTRLWAHIFWRAGPEGFASEQPNRRLRPLSLGERDLSLPAAWLLVGLVVILGLMPKALFDASAIGAADLLDSTRYITAVGLEEVP